MVKAGRFVAVRVVARWEMAITQPALRRAHWRCELCEWESNLRVVEGRDLRLLVLCPTCRVQAGCAEVVGS